MDNCDTSKLSNEQLEIFAILLSEGFERTKCYDASIFYPKDIEMAREFVKGPPSSMRINAISSDRSDLSVEMQRFCFKRKWNSPFFVRSQRPAHQKHSFYTVY